MPRPKYLAETTSGTPTLVETTSSDDTRSMTTAELLTYGTTADQADAILRVAEVADRDLGADTRVVAFRLDADYGVGRGHVTLESGGYVNVVLEDGSITDAEPR